MGARGIHGKACLEVTNDKILISPAFLVDRANRKLGEKREQLGFRRFIIGLWKLKSFKVVHNLFARKDISCKAGARGGPRPIATEIRRPAVVGASLEVFSTRSLCTFLMTPRIDAHTHRWRLRRRHSRRQ